MLELIAEIEAAEEPSADLWHRAWQHCFPDSNSDIFTNRVRCAAWLDSALSLLPTGICPSVGQNVHHYYWYAYAQVVRDGEVVIVAEGNSSHDGALAALAMALRARSV